MKRRGGKKVRAGALSLLLLVVSLFSFSSFASVEESPAQEVSVYPVHDVFVAPTANTAFRAALSKDGSDKGDRIAGTQAFLDEFTLNFPHVAQTIDNGNKYSTLAAYIRIPRASLYVVPKTDQLLDMYLPITMNLTFANMVTGESLYSYTYTYYGRYVTTKAEADSGGQKIVDIYRENYQDLLKKVIAQAKKDFVPFSISAIVKKEWAGDYVLDKGSDAGVAKGDVLVDQHKGQISVVYASRKYCVAQKLLGDPQKDSVFSKFSNQSIDELKKPKVMLLKNKNGEAFIASGSVPDDVVYQLFVDALGKKSAFSLVSVDPHFYESQRSVIEQTGLTQEVTQARELPDYFLKLSSFGPFYVKSPTNKSYASVDTYTVIVCANLLDGTGRALYGACVDDKITDEVYGAIRFPNESREEVIIKNAVIKLADELTKNVKFKAIADQLPVVKTGGDSITVEDKQGVLVIGQVVTVFRKLGRISGIDEDVHVPIWQASIGTKNDGSAVASKVLDLLPKASAPEKGDEVFVDSFAVTASDSAKTVDMCPGGPAMEGDYGLAGAERLFPFLVSQQMKYPFYDTKNFFEAVDLYNNDAGFGFKRKMRPSENKGTYCVEPVVRITTTGETSNNGFTTFKLTLIQGLRVYRGNDVVWKKGFQQDVSISAPNGYKKETLDFDLMRRITGFMPGEIVKKMELKN